MSTTTKPDAATVCWPGTKVPKSTNSAFNWRRTDTTAMSAVICDDKTMRDPLYNQWLTARKDKPKTTPDWPTWRDSRQGKPMPGKNGGRHPSGGGFAHHNGTIPGMGREAKLLAAKPAAPGTMSSAKAMPKQSGLMPIAGHNLQHGKVTPPKATRRGVPRSKKAGAL